LDDQQSLSLEAANQQADGLYILCAQEALTDLLGFNNDPEKVLSRVNASVHEGRTCQQVCAPTFKPLS
jgi:hypothetical protein